uniref:Peptidase M13 C-terminal domain-containing protein n=1 Tax=Panagrolaimus sp. JU765 TaxID=591449 RepID=A0AC34RFB3_9BILA
MYDYDFPWSLIFGSIGIVTGHEVTHGFDSSGTQWDSTGNLNPWMDSQSQTAFNSMAQCVIDEYNQFCPLNASVFKPNCINGFQTQGENIADNGGIHAAFRAYKTAVDVNGDDPRLPGLMSQFNHDQIFFMSFGKILCMPKPNPNREYIQILVDPHSPAKYRVFGSLRNYPAFRNAFNCKVGDAYTPTNHCNVWVSPVGS